MPHSDNTKRIEVKALSNTGLFQEPEKDLREVFDLKTSGREALLLASYGATYTSYYLYDEERVLKPPLENDLLRLPPIPLLASETHPAPSEAVVLPALTLIRRDRRLLSKILKEDKYIVFKDQRYKRERIKESTRRQYMYEHRKELEQLLQEAKRRGVDPVNVLVVEGRLDRKHEGFILPYIAGAVLRSRGYLVAETSLGVAGGDMFAYRTDNQEKGAFLAGLILGIEEPKEGKAEASTIIVEDEAQERILDSRHGVNQALAYLASSQGYFGEAYVTAPFAADHQTQEAKRLGCGIITIDKQGNTITINARSWPAPRQAQLAEEATTIAKLAKKNYKTLLDNLTGI